MLDSRGLVETRVGTAEYNLGQHGEVRVHGGQDSDLRYGGHATQGSQQLEATLLGDRRVVVTQQHDVRVAYGNERDPRSAGLGLADQLEAVFEGKSLAHQLAG